MAARPGLRRATTVRWTWPLSPLAALAALATLVPGPTCAAPAAPSAASEPPGFWTGPINSPVPATISGGKVIHARKLSLLIKDSSAAVIVDVSNAPRKPENLPSSSTWMPLPHPAIPGAIWIPGAGLGEPPPAVDKFYRERLAQATANDLGRTIVLYCHAKCWLSWNGAKRAIQYGYTHVYWFPDGIEGWRKAQQPTKVIEPEPVPEK
jgi:PQQ-dependent catabolism-associated CXXCW motif protein